MQNRAAGAEQKKIIKNNTTSVFLNQKKKKMDAGDCSKFFRPSVFLYFSTSIIPAFASALKTAAKTLQGISVQEFNPLSDYDDDGEDGPLCYDSNNPEDYIPRNKQMNIGIMFAFGPYRLPYNHVFDTQCDTCYIIGSPSIRDQPCPPNTVVIRDNHHPVQNEYHGRILNVLYETYNEFMDIEKETPQFTNAQLHLIDVHDQLYGQLVSSTESRTSSRMRRIFAFASNVYNKLNTQELEDGLRLAYQYQYSTIFDTITQEGSKNIAKQIVKTFNPNLMGKFLSGFAECLRRVRTLISLLLDTGRSTYTCLISFLYAECEALFDDHQNEATSQFQALTGKSSLDIADFLYVVWGSLWLDQPEFDSRHIPMSLSILLKEDARSRSSAQIQAMLASIQSVLTISPWTQLCGGVEDVYTKMGSSLYVEYLYAYFNSA